MSCNLTCPNGTVSNSTATGTGACVEGLGMTPQEYNLLYAIYAWTNAVVVIMAGFLIDKLGNRFGVFPFSFLTVLGSAIFALGSHYKGSTYLLPLMLTGRLLFVVQNRITAFWFCGKELALAFGLTLAFSRLGSVLNFFLTQRFESQYGMQWTLWGGTFLCVLGFLSAVTVSVLDKMGMKQLGLDGVIQEESRKLRVQDVKRLSLRYWLLVLTIMLFYNGIFPFIADASKFIQDKYSGYSQKEAAYIAGTVYDSSLVLSAVVGILIDYVGLRGVFAGLCAVLTLCLVCWPSHSSLLSYQPSGSASLTHLLLRACGPPSLWRFLKPHWAQRWDWPHPYRWSASASLTWWWDRYWEPSPVMLRSRCGHGNI
ncbi:major facilitator superfamily domain-containing protein 1-like [Sinocyclocheilus anshuiensis]|uniref:major facilitator superfamily domain-containing protein 1-like n=1 Tax=Sinocyclocheilus anshuiensis TaxID=1608454 RepID=UPI0007B88CA4|nr:PREDICTED: major facilitator superfamily domain-containing protein 1-like [Sinocyclocheilus anshuiensis]